MALCLAGWGSPARADTSFDFLFSMERVSDDRQYFLSLAVSDYGYSRQVLEPVLPRLRHLEADLPVVLFLARASGKPVDLIVGWRSEGLGWSVIFGRAGVPLGVLFAGIDRDPGPPYGKAWGHWKKDPRGARISDGDIAALAQIQVGSRVTGLAPLALARQQGRGRSVAAAVAEKKGRPSPADRVAEAAPILQPAVMLSCDPATPSRRMRRNEP